MNLEQGRRLDMVLTGIAILSAILNILCIWNNTYANAYYTSAVTSMLQSFHNFFYASFDPGGYVTVDKPPVTFWVQTAFAYIFGVHGWSVILPQALAGVGSVLLMYVLVKPTFGKTAARLASLVIACTPIAVAVSRTNNIDSLLVFTLLIATWMLFRAIRDQKLPWLLGAFAMIGVGFNMKMLQAYMVVPAFYLFFLLTFKSDWKKKLAVLVAATVVLVGVTLSWAVVVDMVPEENRPYIGGSQTNSVLELAFGYNGIARLKGMGRGGGGPGAPPDQRQIQEEGTEPGEGQMRQEEGTRPDEQQAQLDEYNSQNQQQISQGANMPPGGNNMPNGQQAPQVGYSTQNQQQVQQGANMPDDPGRQGPAPGGGGGAPGRGGGGMFNTGNAGPLRLFQSELSGQISWLLPFAAFTSVGLLAGIRRRKPLTTKQNETLFWLAWLLPGMAFFSVAGFFHQYYLIMLAPPIAALAGAGWVELWNQYRDREGWKMWLLPSALLAATAFELYILKPYQNQIGIGWLIGIGVAGAGLALVLCLAAKKQKLVSIAAMAGMLVLLVAPLYWSATPLLYGDNSMMPAAGPSQQGFGQRQGGGGGTISGINTKLLEYVTRNNTGETYLFATNDANTAESYIIETGKAVMPMGGFSGSDPILTVEKLEKMVANKKVKYFLIPGSGSGGGDRGGSNEVMNWIRANSTEVPKEEWQTNTDSSQGGSKSGPMGMGNDRTLYKINV